jgi:hypothetical protein
MSVGNTGKSLVFTRETQLLRARARRPVKAIDADIAAEVLKNAGHAGSRRRIVGALWLGDAFGTRARAEEAVRLTATADAERNHADAVVRAILVAETFLTVSATGGAQELSGRRSGHAGKEAEKDPCGERIFANHCSHDRWCRSQSVFPC